MKRKIIFLITTFLMVNILNADKLIFMEYSLSYSNIIEPEYLSNNDTGCYDTPNFKIDTGIQIYKWIDIYGGIKFSMFPLRKDTKEHYTFFPIYGGVNINIYPYFFIFPSIKVEYGKSISNKHYKEINKTTMEEEEKDSMWIDDYFNLGLRINWRINEITDIFIKIERDNIRNIERGRDEIQIINIGIGYKTYY